MVEPSSVPNFRISRVSELGTGGSEQVASWSMTAGEDSELIDMAGAAAELAAEFATKVSAPRLAEHVAQLAAEPRSSVHAPNAMAKAQSYLTRELEQIGWTVRRDPFVVGWRFGATDRPGTRAMPWKLRLFRRLAGVNLVAELPGVEPGAPTIVLGAHVDSVQGSPGADDNASGVAVLLETARLLREAEVRAGVTLVVFDLEELGLIGSSVAARRLTQARRVQGMLCLESVGY